MRKTFGSAAVTPLTESYQLIQKGSSWVDTNCHGISESAVTGSWQRPAIDRCYNHEKAFKKMRLQNGQNIQSLMDWSFTVMYIRETDSFLLPAPVSRCMRQFNGRSAWTFTSSMCLLLFSLFLSFQHLQPYIWIPSQNSVFQRDEKNSAQLQHNVLHSTEATAAKVNSICLGHVTATQRMSYIMIDKTKPTLL